MRNPVNRLATAAPRALDSLLKCNTTSASAEKKEDKKIRAISFDLDLSALDTAMGTRDERMGSSSSVVTFEDLMGDMMLEEVGSKEWQ
jgi:hypothetical protein